MQEASEWMRVLEDFRELASFWHIPRIPFGLPLPIPIDQTQEQTPIKKKIILNKEILM